MEGDQGPGREGVQALDGGGQDGHFQFHSFVFAGTLGLEGQQVQAGRGGDAGGNGQLDRAVTVEGEGVGRCRPGLLGGDPGQAEAESGAAGGEGGGQVQGDGLVPAIGKGHVQDEGGALGGIDCAFVGGVDGDGVCVLCGQGGLGGDHEVGHDHGQGQVDLVAVGAVVAAQGEGVHAAPGQGRGVEAQRVCSPARIRSSSKRASTPRGRPRRSVGWPVVAVDGGRVEGEDGAAGIEAEGQGRGRQAEVGVITLGANSRVWAVPPP